MKPVMTPAGRIQLDRGGRGAFRGVVATLLAGLFSVVALQAAELAGDHVPSGYHLLYQQSFPNASALGDFIFSDPAAWRYASGPDHGGAMELFGASHYKPPFRSPYNIALIRGKRFGDFVLEAEVIQTGRRYAHRDLCFFFGVQNRANYYYVHLATRADPHAHNIFLVNDAPRVKIAQRTTKGVHWGEGVWHKVRIERTLKDGRIRVYFDDMRHPIMEAVDKHFGAGLIGFGSFDDTGKFTHIRIWGPALVPPQTGFFH